MRTVATDLRGFKWFCGHVNFLTSCDCATLTNRSSVDVHSIGGFKMNYWLDSMCRRCSKKSPEGQREWIHLKCFEARWSSLSTALWGKETTQHYERGLLNYLLISQKVCGPLFREYLTPAELQPLSEVCYYSSSGILRQRLNVTPRTSIQTALSHPFHYLQVNDLSFWQTNSNLNFWPTFSLANMLYCQSFPNSKA